MKDQVEHEVFFSIMDKASGKFIERFTESSGRVYLVKNPFNSNYFLERGYAESWLTESGLSRDKYVVMGFQEEKEQPKEEPQMKMLYNYAVPKEKQVLKSIPMSLLNEEWAKINHSQTLSRLNERGGLSPCEALAVIEKRRYKEIPVDEAVRELQNLIEASKPKEEQPGEEIEKGMQDFWNFGYGDYNLDTDDIEFDSLDYTVVSKIFQAGADWQKVQLTKADKGEEVDKLELGIEIVAAMQASCADWDIETGRILALEDTELDRICLDGAKYEDLSEESQKWVQATVIREKERLHKQSLFAADAVFNWLKDKGYTINQQKQ